MRIYRTDGTFVENTGDTEFGWSFSDTVQNEYPDITKAQKKPLGMKIYKSDGTFVQNTGDTKFGWNFSNTVKKEYAGITKAQSDIVKKSLGTKIHKSDATFAENTGDTKLDWCFPERKTAVNTKTDTNKQRMLYSQRKKCLLEDSFSGSIEVIDTVSTFAVKKIEPDIKIAPIKNVLECIMESETVPKKLKKRKTKLKPLKESAIVDFSFPPKEELARLIIPCNSETKMLLSVIYFAKFKTLQKQEISEELFRTVNTKTTNCKLLNGERHNIHKDMSREIQSYNAEKEDNMYSLMLELILTDVGCNLEDIADVSSSNISQCESSDFEESFPSVKSSKEGNHRQINFLEMPSGSDVLSSLGLSEEYEIIQDVSREIYKMHMQLVDIKCSFMMDERKINNIIKNAVSFRKDLEETVYLNDILHLLEGNIEKVKFKKLPFWEFHKKNNRDCLNLIV